jgi:hypothetical protein
MIEWVKKNALVLILIVVILVSWGTGGVGYKYFKDQNKVLQDSIDARDVRIAEIEVEKQAALDSVSVSHEREEKLRDSLISSQTRETNIRIHYENLYRRIRNSSDAEYLEYLRSRSVPDSN